LAAFARGVVFTNLFDLILQPETSVRSIKFGEKRSELRRRPEKWHWFEFLECRSEGVREAPHGTRSELLMLRLKVVSMHNFHEVLRRIQSFFDKSSVDHELRCCI